MQIEEIKETRISKKYTVKDNNGKELDFTPQVIYRNGKFHYFTLHIENGLKTKYDLKLDMEDKKVFEILKDFFKSIDDEQESV